MSNSEEKSIELELTPDGTLIATYCFDTILIGKYANSAGGTFTRALVGQADGCGGFPSVSIRIETGTVLNKARQWVANQLYKAADFIAVVKRPSAIDMVDAEGKAQVKIYNLMQGEAE